MSTDPAVQPLHDALLSWKRRLALRRGLRRAAWVTLAGGGAVAVFAGVASWVPVPAGPLESPAAWVALGALVTAAAALIAAATARFTVEDAALVADLRHDTGSLFSTAWDAASRPDAQRTEAERACISAAAGRAAELPPAQVAPLRFGWRWATPLLYAALAALTLLPFAEDLQRAVEQQRLTAAAEELKQAEARLEQLPDDAAQLNPALRKELRRLQRELDKGDLTSREALEQIGELKRQLRAEKLAQDARANQAGRGAQEAARELGRAEPTSELAQRLADQSRAQRDPNTSAEERQERAEKTQEAARKLQKLEREERQEAAKSLEQAGDAANKAGDPQLGQLLKEASQALQSGDADKLDQLSEDIAKALQQSQSDQESMEQLAKALDNAQQRLAGVDPQDPSTAQGGQGNLGQGEQPGQGGGDRQWRPVEGDGPGVAGAGTGHQDERTPGYDVTGQHNDADRTAQREPDAKEVDYRALYESANLDDSKRILTRVQGEREGDKIVGSSQGGNQSPQGDERAQIVLKQLPTTYAEDAQRAVNTEEIPPAYRDAVRSYFDTNTR